MISDQFYRALHIFLTFGNHENVKHYSYVTHCPFIEGAMFYPTLQNELILVILLHEVPIINQILAAYHYLQ